MLKERKSKSEGYKKVRKTIFGKAFLIAIPMSLLLLTGCSKIFEQAVNEDEGITYDLNETSIESLDAGVYIKNDNTLYVPYEGHGINISSKDVDNYEADKNRRYIWYTTQLQYVPELNVDGSIIYKSESTVPTSFPLEKFEKLCDTLGIRGISLDSNGKFTMKASSDDLKEGSDAASVFASYSENDTIILDTINDIPFESSMINKAGAISGLELDKSYKLGFYIGTKYHEEVVKADTTVYASKEMYKITRYDGTKLGYIILKLPDLMDPGLYYINGEGTFTYGGLVAVDKSESAGNVVETESDDGMEAAEQAVTETLAINSFSPEETSAEDQQEQPEAESEQTAETTEAQPEG